MVSGWKEVCAWVGLKNPCVEQGWATSMWNDSRWNKALTQVGPSDAINETATDEFKQQIFPRQRGGCYGTNQVKRQIVSGVELHLVVGVKGSRYPGYKVL